MSFKMTSTVKFDKATMQFESDLKACVFMETQEIMADSQKNYVPVQTGHLRSTGYTKSPQPSGDGFTSELGYRATYATYVHEAPPGWGQGRRKYLEKPLMAHGRGLAQRIARRMTTLKGWGRP